VAAPAASPEPGAAFDPVMGGLMDKVNVGLKLAQFSEHWSPRIVGELNGQHVKLAKLEGEFLIIPRGVEHQPVARQEVHVLLFEPAGTLNTGNVRSERTVDDPEHV
jgi:hypothetical protein